MAQTFGLDLGFSVLTSRRVWKLNIDYVNDVVGWKGVRCIRRWISQMIELAEIAELMGMEDVQN